jgi:hypothetical protein
MFCLPARANCHIACSLVQTSNLSELPSRMQWQAQSGIVAGRHFTSFGVGGLSAHPNASLARGVGTGNGLSTTHGGLPTLVLRVALATPQLRSNG